MEWSLLMSGLGRQRPSPSRSGEELLRAIRRSGMVFDALSMRGRREEWGKRRTMHGLHVLREVGSPRFCVSQSPVCAQGLSRCSGTVEVLSSSWTPLLSGRVVVRLRERRQWDSDLLWWFGWSPQFFGFTCVVEQQLDLTSVTAKLRGWPNRAFTSSARPGEELLRAIQRSGVVFDALSTRGCREEWGKLRAMHGLRVLSEGFRVVCMEDPEMFPGLGFSPEKATDPAVVIRSRQADPLGDQLLRWCACEACGAVVSSSF
ncbi:hypothetical protein Taro_040544 [Colocasia esculenta]|uniref:Uncharacterized protein n=1 Tax=Colocasia esculenta TaxID=4460 RepID=A0A843WC49_COLES|nr:hypothetical protein [Colocasia esculenta]